MTQFWFQKKKLPLQWLFKPWFWVAVGLHIVALSIPLPSEPEADRLSTEDLSVDGVRLVSLPSPPSRPFVSPTDSVPASTEFATPTPSTAPKATSPEVAPVSPQPPASPSPPPPIVSEPISAPPEALTPQPLTSPSPQPLASAPPEPQPTPTPQQTPESQQTIVPGNFPHAVGSQPGCGGRDGCWHNENTQWRSIATTLKQDLENQGYTLTPLEIGSDTGMRIYQVVKVGEPPYYLNLLSTQQGTVYIVSEEPLTPEELTAMVNV